MTVDLHLNGVVTTVQPGESLFECAERMGIPVPTSCRKQGKCKECVMEVVEGSGLLGAPGEPERHLRGNFRLSCCARVAAAGTIRAHTMRRGTMRIEKHAFELPAGARPGRLEPAVTRDGERILLDGQEIARGAGPLHGLAIDLGTTTVVLRLLDLGTGEVVADSSFENPQRFGGSDVMARIQYDTEDRTRTLQRTLVGYLGRAIQELPVDPQSIYEVILAGNSTMRDLFFRLSVHSIGQSPYRSITEIDVEEGRRATTTLVENARKLGLPIHPAARVVGLPIVSGHVGADAAACMLAVDIANEDRLVAVMDIGTNTELIVGNRHRVLAASCPAGPAFEGGQISCGMPGLPGAIEKVRIGADGRIDAAVIGGGAPEGICGSGLVDLLGELLRTGRMNALGRFEDGAAEIVVATGGDRPVTFSEADVNALAQAKGANVAGLQIAFAEYGVDFSQLDVFYLAGGFGRHLDLESARRIGLIPHIDKSRIVQVGNAAIEGACLALLSRGRRAELEALVRRVGHCRLETHPGFFDFFVEGCQFRPVGDPAAAEGGRA
ncbi:MAG TPA: ASKHA domain-containing protein [Opitutaceae bacterium]|nr:ASKHA domain-containing protein [Opitutaceae bacterium]